MDSEPVLGGRYRLIGPVGSGGMAVVWQAYDTVLARTVAVKVLAAHYADDPESRALIRQEARSAAALSHPNIAQVYDYGEEQIGGETVPYVVMELIRGVTLQERLSEGPVLAGFAMRICAEVAAALAAAHAEGLVHRDIKPANVMLAPTGAKVVDFGIAAAIKPPSGGTDDMLVLGTPAYLAPERLLHDAVEPASDVYALGVLLYRLLSGRSPWTSETTTQMLTAHIYVDPAPLLPMFAVPDRVTALCNRCLSKEPGRRPSAREVAALLAHGAGLPVVTEDSAGAGSGVAVDPEPSVLIRPPVTGPSGDESSGDGSSAGESSATATAATVPAVSAAPAPWPPLMAMEATVPPVGESSATAVEAPAGVVADSRPPDDQAAAVTGPRKNRSRLRSRHAAVVVALLAAAVAGWFLRPNDPAAVTSAPVTTGAATQPVPGRPPPSGPATASTRPAGTTRAGVARTSIPGKPGGTTPAGTGAPTTGGPAGTAPVATGAVTTAPDTGPTTGDPVPTATAAEPVERTLSSSGGSVRATCPSAGTARILSWEAARSYQVVSADDQAGPAPAVTFRHGNTRLTMTVSCTSGEPSATTT